MKKILFGILLIAFSLGAQGFDAASLGTAGNYTALSRGVEALAWNPANLALPRSGAMEFNFVSMNMGFSNSALSVSDYNRYFTAEGHNGHWSEGDRNDIIDMFSDEGLKLNADTKTNIMGIAIGNFAYALQLENRVEANVNPGKPLEMVLFGETITTDYKLTENNVAGGQGYSVLKHGLGYGHLFKLAKNKLDISHLAVGVGLNFYQGLAVMQTLESSLKVERVDHEEPGMDNEVFRSELRVKARKADASQGIAGSGFGLDIGATAHFKKSFLFSLSFSNLFADVKWTGNSGQVTYVSVDSSHVFEKHPADTSYSLEEESEGNAFRTSLPVAMRIGMQWHVNPGLSLTADYQQGLNTAFRQTVTPRVGVGVEYFPWKWLPLRSGMTVGGKHTFLFAMGSGLHLGPLMFDFSYAMSKGLLPSYSTGAFVAFGLKLRF